MDDATIEAARKGCCDDQRKPCAYHEGWADALASLPDPRPTEAEADAAVRATVPIGMPSGYSVFDTLRDLGCFRPEPADEGAFSWPVTIRPDPEGWEPVDG